ncbi:MAG: VanZ family protein [Deltaproteobacteria bacterium]|nr:VanZ family protein [Deltaproteobacteria bacterium]
MRGRGWRWLPALAHAALIFYLSHQPQWPFAPPQILGVDKLLHLAAFAALAALILFALGEQGATPGGRALVAVLGVGWGVLDELHQAFVPGRFADPWDALADALGVLLVLAVHFAWSRGRARTTG